MEFPLLLCMGRWQVGLNYEMGLNYVFSNVNKTFEHEIRVLYLMLFFWKPTCSQLHLLESSDWLGVQKHVNNHVIQYIKVII